MAVPARQEGRGGASAERLGELEAGGIVSS